mgnify:CR=1 FL=1
MGLVSGGWVTRGSQEGDASLLCNRHRLPQFQQGRLQPVFTRRALRCLSVRWGGGGVAFTEVSEAHEYFFRWLVVTPYWAAGPRGAHLPLTTALLLLSRCNRRSEGGTPSIVVLRPNLPQRLDANRSVHTSCNV